MRSIWVKETEGQRPKFKRLEEDIKTKALIIGGGIAGLLCAHTLKEKGVECILVEKGRICQGATENTTAKITLQNGPIYNKMIERFGKEKASLYVRAQRDALEKYAHLCRKNDCDYENKDAYLYSINMGKKLEEEMRACKELGIDATLVQKTELPFSVAGAVRVERQAQFNPLKFLFEIARDLPIYENTKVVELKGNIAVTQDGATINAEKIIIATHFPILNKHGCYFLKMFQYRSYVLALEGAQELNGMYIDEAEGGLSFRTYKNSLLLGGGGHRTGKKGTCWSELEAFMEKNYKNVKITGKWATQDCITLDGIPYVGRYSKSTPNLYVITGFNKWGMTSSMAGAMHLSSLIAKGKSEYEPIFSPSRTILRPRLALNVAETTINLLTPTVPRCPHLGCALKYNREEHSWDCPCHGSRFSDNGELLDGPATDGKNKL